MAKTKNFLALDLGAESGRALVGRFDGEKLSLEEISRFPNGPVRVSGSLHWDTLRLFQEMKNGLAKAVKGRGIQLAALGIDTWGVDFGLLDSAGNLIGNPYHYRDSRTNGMLEKVFELVSREEIFAQTGIQFMQLNTLFQLFAMAQQNDPALQIANTLLFMPDLFNYWFTGQKANEYTIASTSQMFDMQNNIWAAPLLKKLGLPTDIFPSLIRPGAKLGTVLPAIVEELGLNERVPVIAPGAHDTASAVAAVPASAEDAGRFAYLSSGTWSLMGVETPAPIINEQSLAYNFTNEGGVQNTIRLLKNIMGLWLVQECKRIWKKEGHAYSYDKLTQLAADAPPLACLVNPEDNDFLAPGNMPARISAYCTRTEQTIPPSTGSIVRAALESLALKYRWSVEKLEGMTGSAIEVIHIVGGGARNKLLNQFAANATGKRVVTGPIEATALGNILLQMLAVGEISSLAEGRAIIKRSFPVQEYLPQDTAAWDEAYQGFLALTENS
ncbi:MAG TPA: rhamnulokinase [Chloroflexi bacterium]|nr:rhamnulokinase [Chloroflexota bacterium]